jgi:hypothetical protein
MHHADNANAEDENRLSVARLLQSRYTFIYSHIMKTCQQGGY